MASFRREEPEEEEEEQEQEEEQEEQEVMGRGAECSVEEGLDQELAWLQKTQQLKASKGPEQTGDPGDPRNPQRATRPGAARRPRHRLGPPPMPLPPISSSADSTHSQAASPLQSGHGTEASSSTSSTTTTSDWDWSQGSAGYYSDVLFPGGDAHQAPMWRRVSYGGGPKRPPMLLSLLRRRLFLIKPRVLCDVFRPRRQPPVDGRSPAPGLWLPPSSCAIGDDDQSGGGGEEPLSPRRRSSEPACSTVYLAHMERQKQLKERAAYKARQPRGFSTLWASWRKRGRSNQWKADMTATRSTEPGADSSCSALLSLDGGIDHLLYETLRGREPELQVRLRVLLALKQAASKGPEQTGDPGDPRNPSERPPGAARRPRHRLGPPPMLLPPISSSADSTHSQAASPLQSGHGTEASSSTSSTTTTSDWDWSQGSAGTIRTSCSPVGTPTRLPCGGECHMAAVGGGSLAQVPQWLLSSYDEDSFLVHNPEVSGADVFAPEDSPRWMAEVQLRGSGSHLVLPPIGDDDQSGGGGEEPLSPRRRSSEPACSTVYLAHMERQKQLKERAAYKAEKLRRQRLYSNVIREQNKKTSEIPLPPLPKDPEDTDKGLPRRKALEYAKSIAKPQPKPEPKRQQDQSEGFPGLLDGAAPPGGPGPGPAGGTGRR
ncbi:hypothetical protein CRUP_026016 [Coryphaenoides rupestris]|nr:hypothetical protein CRUP_026016 [Coryphaenoides rupestris]